MGNKRAYEAPVVVRYGSIDGLTGATTLTCSHTDKIGDQVDDYTGQQANQDGNWVCHN